MLKKFGYAALVAAVTFAFALGASSSSEAKGKKMAAPPAQPQPCLNSVEPVCGSLRGQHFAYANACSAYKDGATVVSKGACKVQKAAKHKAKKHKAAKHKAKKAMKKPAKKAAKKKM